MKILQVIDQLGVGGAERVCVNITNLLYRNNYDVKLIVFNLSGPLFDLVDDGVDLVILERKKNRFKAYKKLINEVKKADVIHIHMRQNYKYVKKTLLTYGIKKKLILHDHFGEIAVNKRIPTFYRSWYKPDLYIGCSELLTDWARNDVGLNPSIVFLVHNFVIRYKFDVPENFEKKGLVLVGNLKPVKNHFFAVQIAKLLRMKLTIYCGESKRQYFKDLKKKIDEIEMSDNVIFKYGEVNVQKELYKYDFALLTSTSEGDPLALVEYLSQGIPFLSYNIGESVKQIKKYFPSFILNSFDTKEWLDNFEKAKYISKKQILNMYEENYSSQKFLEKYVSIYKKFITL